MDIARIATIGTPQQPGSVPPAPELAGNSGSFATLLQQSLDQVNGLQHDADAAARGFALGLAPSMHGTMIAMEKADIALRLTMKIRNKVVEAYQDVMRMQV